MGFVFQPMGNSAGGGRALALSALGTGRRAPVFFLIHKQFVGFLELFRDGERGSSLFPHAAREQIVLFF